MSDEYLTIEEINQIIIESKKDQYSDPFMLNLGTAKTSIFSLDRKSGLILIYGNEHFGYKHIFERHSLKSRKQYWDTEGKLDNPSKFRLNIPPIGYVTIASTIYKLQNQNNSENKKRDLFDLYDGQHKHSDGLNLKYRLLTYKNTGIIHTLFLNEKKRKFNKKNIINLRQGWAKCSYAGNSGIQAFEIPYFDGNGIEQYKVIVKYFPSEKKEDWYIQGNSRNGSPLLPILIKSEIKISNFDFQDRMDRIDYEEIPFIEKEIKKMLDKDNYHK